MIYKVYVNEVVLKTQKLSQKKTEFRFPIRCSLGYGAVVCLLPGRKEKANSRQGATVRISIK